MTAEFFEIAENPVPPRARAEWMTARDGKRIRYALFGAAGRPLKGTVVILPGRNECIEKYFETVRDLAGRGFGVATLDWRGQGASDRLIPDPQRGYVDSFFDYVRDVEQFFEDVVLPDCRGPFYVLAHSTGSLVALLAAPSMVNRVQRMMLIAPLIELKGLGLSTQTVRRAASFLYSLGLGTMYFGGGPRPPESKPFATNVLTTDHARYRRNQKIYEIYPHLALGGPTVTWVRAACLAVETVSDPAFIERIQLPIVIVGAGSDEVVSTPAVEAYARLLRATSMLTIDGARHEVLQEADAYREQLFAAFDAFIPGHDA
ncbi:MAG: alpha/beta fold hydrolase [Rhizobiaceae bacterium]